MDVSTPLKLNSRLIPIAVGLLLVMELTFPHAAWLTMLIGLGGLWLVSYLWARQLAGGLQLNRQMRFGWAQVGDHLEERFHLVNAAPVPALWVEIIDHSTLPDYRPGRATGLGSTSQARWHTKGQCTRRGVFTLGPTTLRSGDPFGLYTFRRFYPESVNLTVTPPIVPLPAIEVAPAGRSGEGRPRPNALEQTVSAAGVRGYVPGDSLRWVHWPTSARRNALFVRLFEGTPTDDWWIFLDMEEAAQVGQGRNSTQEHAIILTASLADRGLRQTGRSVGLVAHGRELVWLEPRPGDGQRRRILQALALLESGDRPLAELLTRANLSGSLIIISPAIDRRWVEALIPLLRQGAIVTALLLDPLAFGGEGSMQPVQSLLNQLGVNHHLITPDLLDRAEARPGQQGQWSWRISATGKAIPLRQPRDIAWRELGRK